MASIARSTGGRDPQIRTRGADCDCDRMTAERYVLADAVPENESPLDFHFGRTPEQTSSSTHYIRSLRQAQDLRLGRREP